MSIKFVPLNKIHYFSIKYHVIILHFVYAKYPKFVIPISDLMYRKIIFTVHQDTMIKNHFGGGNIKYWMDYTQSVTIDLMKNAFISLPINFKYWFMAV